MADIARDAGERLKTHLDEEGGHFGKSPIPSEQSAAQSANDSASSPSPLPHDVFGLVLPLGSIEPVWSLGSLFCYRGLWHNYKREIPQSVVLTVATGWSSPLLLAGDTNRLQTRQQSRSCAMNGKCIAFLLSFFSYISLLYLHTGSPMGSISHPVIWKASPSRSEIAIVYKCNDKERSLAQVYLDKGENKPYRPPSVPKLCSFAVKVVEVVDQFHSKQVRHGSLRPDVIGVWDVDGQVQICIRDFSESRVLGERDDPVDAAPASNELLLNFPSTILIHYVPPETILPGQPSKCLLPVSPTYCLIAVDHRADFYSLGAILHQLITGRPLFHEYVSGDIMTTENARQIAIAHRSTKPPPPTAGKHALLDGLVLQLLQKSPVLRYQSGEIHWWRWLISQPRDWFMTFSQSVTELLLWIQSL